jgi:hypothetical protein
MIFAQTSQGLYSGFKKISSVIGSISQSKLRSKHARKDKELYVEKGLCEEAALDLNRFLATHGKGLLTLIAYFLAAALQGKQKLQLSQALWGELLGVEARNASRILSKAVAYGFIIKIRHPGGRTTYILKDIFLTQSVLLSLQWLLQTVDSSHLDKVINKGETTIIYRSNIKRVYLNYVSHSTGSLVIETPEIDENGAVRFQKRVRWFVRKILKPYQYLKKLQQEKPRDEKDESNTMGVISWLADIGLIPGTS